MSTEKQLAANRLNAKKSTGPRTEYGKQRSRRNAFRHGLTAETVIDVLEDQADYKALASRINADYRPRTNFELELVARLVSLLWRLRRAVAIESGLFDIQAKVLQKCTASERADRDKQLSPFYTLIPALTPKASSSCDPSVAIGRTVDTDRLTTGSVASDIARSFARISSDGDAFERLGRYEIRLWRQAAQTILLLNSINHGASTYADCDDKYFHFRNGPGKRRRIRWPPFATSE